MEQLRLTDPVFSRTGTTRPAAPRPGGRRPAAGDLDETTRAVLLDRLLAKVVADPRPDGCSYWVGAIADDGYGRFQADIGVGSPTVAPHIFLWELRHGPVPASMRLLHVCDETSCVDDRHLDVGTQSENIRQMVRRGRSPHLRHAGGTDTRGAARRARAIAAALRHGWDESALSAAVAQGDPHHRQHQIHFG